MTDETAVVRPYYAHEEAYNMGYSEFFDPQTPPEDEADLAPFHDSARYANTILPRLRAMAGCSDSGHGTYTGHRKVAAVKPGCEEDEPADAVLVHSAYIFEILVDAYNHGARDALVGNEKELPEYPGL